MRRLVHATGRPPRSRTDPSKYRDRIGRARDEGRNGNSRETARRARRPKPTHMYFDRGRAAGAETTSCCICAEPSFVGVIVESWKRHYHRHHIRSISCQNIQLVHSTRCRGYSDYHQLLTTLLLFLHFQLKRALLKYRNPQNLRLLWRVNHLPPTLPQMCFDGLHAS